MQSSAINIAKANATKQINDLPAGLLQEVETESDGYFSVRLTKVNENVIADITLEVFSGVLSTKVASYLA